MFSTPLHSRACSCSNTKQILDLTGSVFEKLSRLEGRADSAAICWAVPGSVYINRLSCCRCGVLRKPCGACAEAQVAS